MSDATNTQPMRWWRDTAGVIAVLAWLTFSIVAGVYAGFHISELACTQPEPDSFLPDYSCLPHRLVGVTLGAAGGLLRGVGSAWGALRVGTRLRSRQQQRV